MEKLKRFLPVVLALMFVGVVATSVVYLKRSSQQEEAGEKDTYEKQYLGTFDKQRSCARLPHFLKQMRVAQPVMIDLSQQRFKGVAFLYGRNLQRSIHRKVWERYGHLGTYALDEHGDLFLTPIPFISIHPETFALQQNIYRIDSKNGDISLWMHLDDVSPSPANPYGLISIVYDCNDRSLWVSAIDESDYRTQRGVIYHIDTVHRKILEKIEGIDALSLALVQTLNGKFLLVGSARENMLYAYAIGRHTVSKTPFKVLTLPDANMRIRKIKAIGKNRLELQAIPFSYSLIAQTDDRYRTYFKAYFDKRINTWTVQKER